MAETVDASPSQGVADLEGWWNECEATLQAQGMALFPLSELPTRSVLEWPEDRMVEAFLGVARTIGVRLIYVFEMVLTPELADGLGVAQGHERLGQRAYIQLIWVYEGVRHACTTYADWYLPILDTYSTEFRAAREAEEAEKAKLQAAIPEMAAALARNPAFGPAPGGAVGRQSVGQAMFPDLTSDILRHVLSDAWTIYSNEVLPEQDRTLAQKARALMATGVSRTEAARRVGLSRDRLGRILAAYVEPEDGQDSSSLQPARLL